jgi:hypothetical protein
MTFTCPECLASSALVITNSITLAPDSRSDDIILQVVRCQRCNFRGAAIYEESRRGSLDSESWEHRGYRIAEEALANLVRMIKSCPSKKDPDCACSSHRALGKKNEFGRWQAPFEINWERSFPIRRT